MTNQPKITRERVPGPIGGIRVPAAWEIHKGQPTPPESPNGVPDRGPRKPGV